MSMFFVKSWPLPKRGGGTYPKGYVSAQVDGADHKDAAIGFMHLHLTSHIGERRYIEVDGAWSGVRQTFTLLPDGSLVHKKGRFG